MYTGPLLEHAYALTPPQFITVYSKAVTAKPWKQDSTITSYRDIRESVHATSKQHLFDVSLYAEIIRTNFPKISLQKLNSNAPRCIQPSRLLCGFSTCSYVFETDRWAPWALALFDSSGVSRWSVPAP